MAVTCNFMDDHPVTAADLNGIDAALQATEPTAYTASTPIGVDQLNQITKNLISKGVCSSYGNRCKVSKVSGSNVQVATGRGFFDNGAVMTIDAPVTLPYTPGSTHYVWLKYDFDANVAEVACTVENPSATTSPSLHYVLLAQVSGSGAVTDKREYALMKNASVLPNQYYTQTDVNVYKEIPSGETLLLKSISVGQAGYRYLYVAGGKDSATYRGFVELKADPKDSVYTGIYNDYGGTYGSFSNIPVACSLTQGKTLWLTFSLVESTLNIYGSFTKDTSLDDINLNETFSITLM